MCIRMVYLWSDSTLSHQHNIRHYVPPFVRPSVFFYVCSCVRVQSRFLLISHHSAYTCCMATAFMAKRPPVLSVSHGNEKFLYFYLNSFASSWRSQAKRQTFQLPQLAHVQYAFMWCTHTAKHIRPSVCSLLSLDSLVCLGRRHIFPCNCICVSSCIWCCLHSTLPCRPTSCR